MMDMDVVRVKNLSIMDVEVALKLKDLAENAKKISNYIYQSHRSFGIGEEKITVWREGSNAEYLTHSGKWEARYLNQSFDVDCTPNGVFQLLKSKYLIEHDATTGMEEKRILEKWNCFKSFIKRIDGDEAIKKDILNRL